MGRHLQPARRAPTPPLFPLLNGKGQQQFKEWADWLHKHGPAGGNAADIAYQRRVAGHAEYDLPLPNGRVIKADGLRSQDGAVIDAKNVRNPDCSPRTLDGIQQSPDNHQPWEKNIYRNDADEIKRYGQALGTPGSEAKFLEVDTNDPNSTGYWDYLLTKNHTKGYARYVP